MNKTELTYIKNRISVVVKCTNGNIATKLNKSKKSTGLTDSRKYKMIADGKAMLKTEMQILELQSAYNGRVLDRLLMCYEYPTTEKQREKIAHNKIIENKIDSLMLEVELAGNRLLDNIVLGIIEASEVPNALHELGEMVNLAKGN